MKKIVIFDTYIGTSNTGDLIIQESCEKELQDFLDSCFIVKYATHLKNFGIYSFFRTRQKRNFIKSSQYKLITGTNLLSYNLFKTRRQWVIGLFSSLMYKNVILMGVGTTQNEQKVSLYSKLIYKKILNKNAIHSVRDEQSKKMLESMGFKVINTGCPTLWCLNKSLCNHIPTHKSSKLVFSLSGYKDQCNRELDKKLLQILFKNYNERYFWCQTTEDEKYLESLNIDTSSIKKIYTLNQYEKILKQGNIDYIGTRLHGGVFALQHKVRTIVISIDYRAEAFHKYNNLMCVKRNQLDTLDDIINSEFKTNIILPIDNINAWKSQFK